jgi:RND family efflux transporter MFP subunit
VLEKFTRAKTLEDLESKRDTAEAKMHAEEAAFALEEGKLKRLTTMLEKCTIEAPRDGMVIYANEPGGRPGAQTVSIEEGSAVRERQSILRLPDLEHMQVKTLINEAKVERVRPGMRARIRIQDADYQGTVATVANQAEPASFFASAVKVFATIVKIDDDEIPHDGARQLKPGMTANVEILVSHLNDILYVPTVAVVEQAGHYFAWVKSGGRADRRELRLGNSNATMIEVKSGLSQGEEVLLNPLPYAGDLAAEFKTDNQIDVKQRYGEQPKGPKIGPTVGGDPATSKNAGERTGRGGRGNLMQHDANKDGKVSREEAPERMAQFFDNVDLNHDGFIDAKEAAAASAARKKRDAEGGGPPAG